MGIIYRRDTKTTYEEEEYQQGLLTFLYQHMLGRCLLKIVIKPSFSQWVGRYYDSPKSIKKISKFIHDNHIDMNQFEPKTYASFNDFFTRKKKEISFEENPAVFCAPADSKLLVYPITPELTIPVKNSIYSLSQLIGEEEASLQEFQNGNCLVFRLAVDDYHRYHYIDDGTLMSHKKIPGVLHTVRSISEEYKVYTENMREVSLLSTSHFGNVYAIEVGAILVGKIQNHPVSQFQRGEEKGFFEYGGSTVILLTNDKVKIEDDILHQSANHIETKVKVGEPIGRI